MNTLSRVLVLLLFFPLTCAVLNFLNKIKLNKVMDSFIGDILKDTLNYIYRESRKKRNQKKISLIIDIITKIAVEKIQPYMYAIIAILIILFLMNCFQFYYYIKMVMILNNNKNLIDADTIYLLSNKN